MESTLAEVRLGQLDPEGPLPVLVTPARPGVSLAQWVEDNLSQVEERLLREGGLLFRGFEVNTGEGFERVAKAFGHELLPYTERTAPRVEVRPHVYTSTEHPSSEYIHFHNANSYSHRWPMKIWFGSLKAATEGGHTPIADCRRVYQRIDATVREEFERRGVMYLRNFREHVGLPWQETFQTTDPDAVRRYCAEAGIEIEVLERDRLRLRQVRHAVVDHPVTGDRVWFNQAHLFHISGLDPSIARILRRTYAEEDLPRNSYYGDGGDIDPEVLAHIVASYREAEASFPWEVGDVLVLDNVLTAHSRTPFEGERLTIVAFAEMSERRTA